MAKVEVDVEFLVRELHLPEGTQILSATLLTNGRLLLRVGHGSLPDVPRDGIAPLADVVITQTVRKVDGLEVMVPACDYTSRYEIK